MVVLLWSWIAALVEHWSTNPLVSGSNPGSIKNIICNSEICTDWENSALRILLSVELGNMRKMLIVELNCTKG